MRGKTSLTTLFGGWMILAPLLLNAQSQAPVSDEQTQSLVEHKLKEAGILKGNVSASVKEGVVLLSGMVPHIWAKQKAIELSLEVPGVREVESGLTIAGAESNKDLASIARPTLGVFNVENELEVGSKR